MSSTIVDAPMTAPVLGVIALCVGVSWAWLRVFPIGPLEWVLRQPGRVPTGTG